MLNDRVKKSLERIISQYFNGNRIYDSAYFWARKNKLVKLSNYFHQTAHQKPLNADIFIEYVLQNISKDENFDFYEIPSANTTYSGLLELAEVLWNYEVQTKELLDEVISICSLQEIDDQETIDLINRIYDTQRNYIDRACTLRDTVLMYGNTPRDWVDISVRIDDIISMDWSKNYG